MEATRGVVKTGVVAGRRRPTELKLSAEKESKSEKNRYWAHT